MKLLSRQAWGAGRGGSTGDNGGKGERRLCSLLSPFAPVRVLSVFRGVGCGQSILQFAGRARLLPSRGLSRKIGSAGASPSRASTRAS